MATKAIMFLVILIALAIMRDPNALNSELQRVGFVVGLLLIGWIDGKLDKK